MFERKAGHPELDITGDMLDHLHHHRYSINIWREGGRLKYLLVHPHIPGQAPPFNPAAVKWLVHRLAEANGVNMAADVELSGVMRGERYTVVGTQAASMSCLRRPRTRGPWGETSRVKCCEASQFPDYTCWLRPAVLTISWFFMGSLTRSSFAVGSATSPSVLKGAGSTMYGEI